MKSVLISILAVTAACATTGHAEMGNDVGARTGVQLKLAPTHDASRVFPQAIAPALPSADRFAHSIHMRFGDQLVAELDLCVATSGAVTSAKLVESTGLAELDTAIESDAAAWRFEPMPGPNSLKTCERAQVTYRAP